MRLEARPALFGDFQGSLHSVTAALVLIWLQDMHRVSFLVPRPLLSLGGREVPGWASRIVCGIAVAPTSGVVESPARTVMQAGKCRVQREPTRR